MRNFRLVIILSKYEFTMTKGHKDSTPLCLPGVQCDLQSSEQVIKINGREPRARSQCPQIAAQAVKRNECCCRMDAESF